MDKSGRCFITEALSAIFMPKIEYRTSLLSNEERFFISKEQRLKVVTDELNQAAIEAKKNAPKREKTCYFERAKMKRDAARLGKKPKTPKDQTKGRSKKQGIE